jgi:hypothetical protein
VTRFLLDTNIISDATRPAPAPRLAAWLAGQPDEALHIASLTVAEIERGILELPAGRRRRALEAWFAGREGPAALFAGRILAFDERAAATWARLMAEGTATGRPRSALDMIVAATALANDCTIVTDNERDFAGLPCFNPRRGR